MLRTSCRPGDPVGSRRGSVGAEMGCCGHGFKPEPSPVSHCLLPLLPQVVTVTPQQDPLPSTHVAFHVIHAQCDALVRVVPLVVLTALAPPAQPVLDHLQEMALSSRMDPNKGVSPVDGGMWCQGGSADPTGTGHSVLGLTS